MQHIEASVLYAEYEILLWQGLIPDCRMNYEQATLELPCRIFPWLSRTSFLDFKSYFRGIIIPSNEKSFSISIGKLNSLNLVET